MMEFKIGGCQETRRKVQSDVCSQRTNNTSFSNFYHFPSVEIYASFGDKIQYVLYLSMQIVILVLWVFAKYDQSSTYASFFPPYKFQ